MTARYLGRPATPEPPDRAQWAVLLLGSLALAMLLVCALPACGSTIQRGLNTGASVLVQASQDMVPIYAERDAVCRVRNPPVLAGNPLREERRLGYDTCMQPVDRIRMARAATDRLLRAAQAAYDASGEDGFKARVPCLLESAQQLAAGLAELVEQVPDELPDLIAFLRAYIAPGQECAHVGQ